MLLNQKTLDFAEEVSTMLENNKFYGVTVIPCDKESCTIYIDNGDWKHEHRCLMNLLDRAGYDYEREITDEDDGDDCYSAYYTITKEVE